MDKLWHMWLKLPGILQKSLWNKFVVVIVTTLEHLKFDEYSGRILTELQKLICRTTGNIIYSHLLRGTNIYSRLSHEDKLIFTILPLLPLRGALYKKLFLKISQYSQKRTRTSILKNTCERLLLLIAQAFFGADYRKIFSPMGSMLAQINRRSHLERAILNKQFLKGAHGEV